MVTGSVSTVRVAGSDVWTRRSGSGSPAVVFVTGFMGRAGQWIPIADRVGAVTEAVLYDRPGHGRSSRSPQPRSMLQVVEELHGALSMLGVETPWVLVGHSIGGLYARVFAREFGHDVAGLVLIDSSVEGQRQARSRSRHRNTLMNLRPVIEVLISPRRVRGADRRTLLDELREFRRAVDGPPALVDGALGDTPIVIVTQRPRPTTPGWKDWERLQAGLTRLSINAQHAFSQIGGHDLHNDNPDLVVGSVLRVVTAARAGKPLAALDP